MIGLLVLCLVLAGVAAFAWWHATTPPKSRRTARSPRPRRAPSGLQAATTLTQKVLSYNWQTLDQDVKATEAVLAPSFRKRVREDDGRRPRPDHQEPGEADGLGGGHLDRHRATAKKVVALVFVNQITTAKGTTSQRLDQNRVLVTLTPQMGESGACPRWTRSDKLEHVLVSRGSA